MADPYLPPEVRREILRKYGKRYGLKVFIETGTADGNTPAALLDDFDQLYTIEVGEAAYRRARRRFVNTAKVLCLWGDSAEVLPQVLKVVGDQPALLWLDGHYCGGDRGAEDTPILAELEAIFATGPPHVVLIDDARLFEGMTHFGEHDWPHVDAVRELAEKHGYTYKCEDDIIRLTP